MDSQGSYNFQDLFNQGNLQTSNQDLIITGLSAGVIGVNQIGQLTDQVSTDDLKEGGVNLYYQTARMRQDISAQSPITYEIGRAHV